MEVQVPFLLPKCYVLVFSFKKDDNKTTYLTLQNKISLNQLGASGAISTLGSHNAQ